VSPGTLARGADGAKSLRKESARHRGAPTPSGGGVRKTRSSKRLPRFNELVDIRSTRACKRATVSYGGWERETANSKSHGRVSARHAATSGGPSGRSWETRPHERPTGHSTEVKSPRHLERWRGPGEIQSWEIESLDCPQGTRAATVDALVSTPLRMGCREPARPRPLPRRCIHTPKGCQDRDQMCVSRPRVG